MPRGRPSGLDAGGDMRHRSLSVRESADRASAKIVDLDPDQQGVSMLFGLTVRLVDSQGALLVQGEVRAGSLL